ncbi:MAG: hypothetical protein AOA65_1191 [Candidatus Bathyarchaeota archaeon BA1]|nr:MAG: hypothetical protein AOA65_1191 [Candidatus Bathyarchaeota archaeon BA1]
MESDEVTITDEFDIMSINSIGGYRTSLRKLLASAMWMN